MKKWIALCGAVLALGLLADLETFEGITATARAYYAWTDSLTDAPDDGKAFFGRDAMANYCIIGSRQLGAEVFGDGTLVPDKDVFRRLWDNYYVPYINGWFTASGRFRSDSARMGDIVALVGSSSGSIYFPSAVSVSDSESYRITCTVLPAPIFAGGARYAVQQGAGMCVIKSDSATEDDATRLKQQRCQRFGMHIAMDDFGTGYSNDSVLFNISPDFVKVDIGIIRGIDQDKNRQTLFRNLGSLCREMRVQVIAEGVETAEELRTVVALGADYLQGYYLSRPAFQPAPVSEKALQERRAAWNSREETTLPPS